MGPTRQVWVRAKAHVLEGARHPAHPGPLHVTTHHLITPTCCPACSCHRFLALRMTHAPDSQVKRHVPLSDDWLPQCDAARGARSSTEEPGEGDDDATPLALRRKAPARDSLGFLWLRWDARAGGDGSGTSRGGRGTVSVPRRRRHWSHCRHVRHGPSQDAMYVILRPFFMPKFDHLALRPSIPRLQNHHTVTN